MAGPLSVKMQAEQEKHILAGQQKIIKMLNDEQRAKELHKLKLAEKVQAAAQKGLDISAAAPRGKPATIGPLGRPAAPQPQQMRRPTNPEAGPNDTVPAMLSPGEAVIPAGAAQAPENKGIIARLVEQGRAMAEGIVPMMSGNSGGIGQAKSAMHNRQAQLDKAAGYEQGTTQVGSLPPIGQMPKPKSIWEMITTKKKPKVETPSASASAPSKASGSMIDNAKAALGNRQAQLDKKEKEALGYEAGTTAVPFAGSEDIDGILAVMKKYDPDLNVEYVKEAYSKASPEERNRLMSKVADLSQSKPSSNELAGNIPQFGKEKQLPATVQSLRNEGPMTAADRAGILADNAGSRDPAVRAQVASVLNGIDNTSVATPASSNPVDQAVAQAEMARINPAVPPIQKPDGFIPKTTDPTAGMVPAPKAPDGFIPKKPVVTVPGEIPRPSSDDSTGTAQVAERLDATLADPVIKQELDKLQTMQPPPNVEEKDWLSEQLGKIFGKTGMFNEEDLLRFSILAAGGLLTGGNVGGSLRFAGLSALRQSDERRQMQAAAIARRQEQQRQQQLEDYKYRRHMQDAAIARRQEQQLEDYKNRREGAEEGQRNARNNNESLEKVYYQKLDNANPEIRGQADKIFTEAKKAKTYAEAEAKYSQAIRLLASNQVDRNKDGMPRTPVPGYNAKTGKEVQYFWDDNNNMLVRDPNSGGYVDAVKSGQNVISATAYTAKRKEQESAVEKGLAMRLMMMNRRNGKVIDPGYTDTTANAQAKGLAAEVMRATDTMGHDMDPKDFDKIVSHAMGAVQENFRGEKLTSLTPEALNRLIMGSAVISLRVTNSSLYKAGNKSGRPNEDATVMYGSAINKAVAEGYDKDAVISHWEEKYKALPDKQKKDWNAMAKSKPGYSPYLLWVEEQTKNR